MEGLPCCSTGPALHDTVRRQISYKEDVPPIVEPQVLTAHKRHTPRRPNEVSTTRFTLLTWLPKSLFLQFQRAANIYFLFVSILVCLLPEVSMWQATALPFACVLGWTCLKDMYEDMRRQRDDDAENLRKCWCYDVTENKFSVKAWQDVIVGDILVTLQDEALPADVLVVRADAGQSFISTVNLDGETNLKERRACDMLSAMMEHAGEDLRRPSSRVGAQTEPTDALLALAAMNGKLIHKQGMCFEVDPPRAGLTMLSGKVWLTSPSEPVQATLTGLKVESPCLTSFENFIPRGCVLRNARWVISIVAYTGEHTKTRLNVSPVEAKVSNMQHYLNAAVQGLVVTLALFCLYCAIHARMLGDPEDTDSFLIKFFKCWIVMYQVVPISLYVFFEVLKLMLGARISIDEQMRDPRTRKLAVARTADLVEEMGQVGFVFSDKTGTLTENEMVFAHCFVAGEEAGDFRPPQPNAHEAKTPNAEEAPGLVTARHILAAEDNPVRAEFRWFFLCLAVCHTAQVEMDPDGNPHYSGSSPDEVAFLKVAHAVGITYECRRRLPGHSGWEVHISAPGEGRHIFTVLAELAFTSERKRMSVVVEHRGEYFCITKGGDHVVAGLCDEPFAPALTNAVSRFSKQGLRTLVFASKVVDGTFVSSWVQRVAAANASNGDQADREERLAAVAAEMELGLMVSGVTATEDRLQEGLADAISTIKAAGIRFWMLTGDKTETAVEISRACRLFEQDMCLVYLVNTQSDADALRQVKEAIATLTAVGTAGGVILDGSFCQFALQSEELRKLVYELAHASTACVCCRLSPQQKRKLVEVVRHQNKHAICAAIGDGANDVSMIQSAHVGIGIRGKEGNQAVQASDVAISQFRFLVPLLLLHGRRAYRRVSTFLCFFLYKHVVLVMCDVIWQHQSRFRGQISLNEWLSSAYPSLLTSFPVLVVLVFDTDLPDSVALDMPKVYSEGILRMRFNVKVFISWMLSAAWHGALAWSIPSAVLGSDDYESSEFWLGSSVSFLLVVTMVSIKLWLTSLNPSSPCVVGAAIFAIFGAVVVLVFLSETGLGYLMSSSTWYLEGVASSIVRTRDALAVLFLTPMGLLVDGFVLKMSMHMHPLPLDRARMDVARNAGGVTTIREPWEP